MDFHEDFHECSCQVHVQPRNCLKVWGGQKQSLLCFRPFPLVVSSRMDANWRARKSPLQDHNVQGVWGLEIFYQWLFWGFGSCMVLKLSRERGKEPQCVGHSQEICWGFLEDPLEGTEWESWNIPQIVMVLASFSARVTQILCLDSAFINPGSNTKKKRKQENEQQISPKFPCPKWDLPCCPQGRWECRRCPRSSQAKAGAFPAPGPADPAPLELWACAGEGYCWLQSGATWEKSLWGWIS